MRMFLAASVILAITATAAPAQVQKWIDKDGTIHLGDEPPLAPAQPTTTTREAIAPTGDGKQAGRERFIEKLYKTGIISRVEVPATLPHVYVGRTFYHLKFRQKQSFMDALLSYYFVQNPKANILVIKDAYTGKQIGQLDKYGLHLN